MTKASLLCRFQGCLLGAVFGDCLGAKFEREWTEIPYDKVIAYMNKIIKKVGQEKLEKGSVFYTDDSCMTFDLAKSLVGNKKYDAADVAKNFSETYFSQPTHRSYGGNVAFVFFSLKQMNYAGDVYRPAREQFDGSGSYGNGSAMRVSPVPLFHHNNISSIVELSCEQSKLTHTHPLGMNGAILQSLAIEKALLCEESVGGLDPIKFCSELKQQYKDVTTVEDDKHVYEGQIDHIIRYLKSTDLVKAKEINERIGSDVTAQKAVPAAIFAFLYTLDAKRIPQLTKFNGFLRAVIFAVGFSEDCDTVGSMAAAIAGAYYGVDMIPKEWTFACEGGTEALELAEQLYDLHLR